MRLTLAAVGRLKDGAERSLCERYVERLKASGRQLGIKSVTVRELSEARHATALTRKDDEARRLIDAVDDASVVIALDETGRGLTSAQLAETLERWRDGGEAHVAFVLGGPDGHGPALLERASLTLALGPMTFPHGLARIVIAEQLYRASTILAGHPYHRV
ncbi:MAG: 23S rRNA (pseudouridine(1915)-N(3))-methyltransferase RlmH [Pseudomonadota bacterium]